MPILRLLHQSLVTAVLTFLVAAWFTTGAAAQEKPAPSPLIKLDPDGNPLPPHALMRLGSLRFRTENSIETLSLSPDKRWIAAATEYGEIFLMERATGKLVSRWKPAEPLYQLTFSPDSKQLAGLSYGLGAFLWETPGGKQLFPSTQKSPADGAGKTADINSIFFSRDGKLLALATPTSNHFPQVPPYLNKPGAANALWLDVGVANDHANHTLQLMDVRAGKILLEIQAKRRESFSHYQASPDGETLIVCIRQTPKYDRNRADPLPLVPRQKVQILDLPRGKVLYTVERNDESQIVEVAFSSVSKRIALTTVMGLIVTDLSGKELGKIDREGIYGNWPLVRFFPDGKHFFFHSAEAQLEVWSVDPLKQVRTLDIGAGSIYGWDAGGTMLANHYGNRIRLWDVAQGKEIVTPNSLSHTSAVGLVRFSPDGRLLASASHETSVSHLSAFGVGGRPLLWAVPGNPTLNQAFVWNLPQGQAQHTFPGLWNSMAFSADGKRLTGTSLNGDVASWHTGTGKAHETWKLQQKDEELFTHAVVAADGRSVCAAYAVQSGDFDVGPIRVSTLLYRFDAATGNIQGQSLFNLPELSTLHLAPNGKTAAAHGIRYDLFSSNAFGLLPVSAGNRWRSIAHALPNVYSPKLDTSTSSLLLACGDDSYVSVVEIPTGQVICRLLLYRRYVEALALSPDGRYLAVADTTRPFIDEVFESVQHVWELSQRDWKLVQTTVDEQCIRIFDVLTGTEITRFHGVQSRAQSLSFSPDGSRLASGLENGTVLIWDTSFIPKRSAAPTELSAQERDRIWEELKDERAWKAYQAMNQLVQAPPHAVKLCRERLADLVPVDTKLVARLALALDSKSYIERQKATHELLQMREFIEPALRQAMSGKGTLEKQQRLHQILKHEPPFTSPTMLRLQRTLQVLEWIGDDDARALLRELMQHSAGTVVGVQAEAILARLTK
jgi:WD40 repeat protein